MTGPLDAQRDLGTRLLRLRELSGIKAYELAKAAGWSASKVSKIEHGNQIPTEDDIRTWCERTGALIHLPDLIATVRNVRAAYVEWPRLATLGLTHRQNQSGRIESDTQLVRGYDNELVPGLLQTEAYARAVLATCISFSEIPDDLDHALDARMKRQRVLAGKTRRFHFLLAEQALYRRVGDDNTMGEQQRTLIDHTIGSQIALGIVPLHAAFEVPTTSFLMYDRSMVQIETATAELTITQPRELRLYEKAFRILLDQAVHGDGARTLIRKAWHGPTPTPAKTRPSAVHGTC